MTYIQSAQNSKLKHLKKLLSTRSYRDTHKQFVLESPIFIRDLLTKYPDAITHIFVSEEHAPEWHLLPHLTVYTVPCNILKPLASGTFQGIFAIATQPSSTYIPDPSGHTLLLLDQLQNPSNVGAIIRNAAAFEANAILLTKGTADPYHPDSIKAMAGNGFHVPLIWVDEDVMNKHFTTHTQWYGLTLDRSSLLHQTSFPKCRGFILGSEGHGVSSDFIINLPYTPLTIEHSPKVDSLNVAVTSGVLLHHLSSSSI